MNSIGTAKKYECLKLFIHFQRKYGYADIENPLDEEQMNQTENGFVIGGDYDGYLYIDYLDDSIWLYFPEDGSIEKVANSY